jgi:membrane-associated protease RseP (regulator of RpoE activity)
VALIGALAFVLALLVSVVLHEAGHFATAKAFGMKATQFFVGFGPTIWSRKKGETEYGFKAIPAGGFVKIVGMTPLEELEDPDDTKRAFYKFPAGRKAIVLVAGSTMHFLLAIFLVFLALLISPIATSAPVIAAPATCLSSDATQACTSADQGSPAAAAGLQSGDRLISVGGTKVDSFGQLRNAIRADKSGAPLAVTYQRGSAVRTTTITPKLQTQPNASGTGTVKVPVLGITAQQAHIGAATAARKTITTLGTFVTGTASSLAHFPQRISTIFSNHRDPNGAVGVIGISRVSGDLLSGGTGGGGGIGWDTRIGDFLLLVAGVNLFVGVFNLLPLMPLDGGHLAVLGFEQVRDRLRRLRGYRGELKRVDMTKLLPATYAVVAIFATLTLVLAAADIVNPIRLG